MRGGGRAWSYAISRRAPQFWGGFVAPVILALVAVSIAALLGLTDTGDELSRSSGWIEGLVALGAVAVIVWRLFQVLQPVSAQVAGYVQGPDYAAHMGYQNEVIEDLKFLRGRLPGRPAKAAGRRGRRSPKIEPRIIVFVDDLDRCSDESIMETLQAINLVLGQSDFFVVLAIDQDMIHRAIARQRGLSDDDEAAAAFAENYLRKIIQLPLHLPHRTAEQRFGFVTSSSPRLLSASTPPPGPRPTGRRSPRRPRRRPRVPRSATASDRRSPSTCPPWSRRASVYCAKSRTPVTSSGRSTTSAPSSRTTRASSSGW